MPAVYEAIWNEWILKMLYIILFHARYFKIKATPFITFLLTLAGIFDMEMPFDKGDYKIYIWLEILLKRSVLHFTRILKLKRYLICSLFIILCKKMFFRSAYIMLLI